MRRPTDLASTYDWWRRALAGQSVFFTINEVHAGFFMSRGKRGGPLLPVAVWLQQEVCPETGELMNDEMFVSVIGLNKPMSAEKTRYKWPYWARRPITEEEYWRQIRQLEHERDNPPEPEEPAYEPEHIRDMPPSF